MNKNILLSTLLLSSVSLFADTLPGGSSVTGDFDVDGNLNVDGSATVDGILTVEGEEVLNAADAEGMIWDEDYISPFHDLGGLTLYNSFDTNVLYAMDKRGTVTLTNFNGTSDASLLFNGITGRDISSLTDIADGITATVEIEFPELIGYSRGIVVIWTEYDKPAASASVTFYDDEDNPYQATARVRHPNNDTPRKYFIFDAPDASDIGRIVVSIEGKITNNYPTSLQEIEYHMGDIKRDELHFSPTLLKYSAQTLYYDLAFKDSSLAQTIKLEPESGKVYASEFVSTGSDVSIGSGSNSYLFLDDNNTVIFGDKIVTLSGNNNFIYGQYSGENLTTSSNNIAMGYQSLRHNTTGGGNVALGSETLRLSTEGENNVAIGSYALSNSQGDFNVAIGHTASRNSLGGNLNIAIGRATMINSNTDVNQGPASQTIALGYAAMAEIQDGYGNIAIGAYTADEFENGNRNTFLGAENATVLSTGTRNTFLGHRSGYVITNGSYNTLIGNSSAYNLTSGSYNISIGNNTEMPNATGSNQLNIGNTIYGDTSTKKIGINKAAPETTLHVGGDGKVDGNFEVDGVITMNQPAGDISMGIFGAQP